MRNIKISIMVCFFAFMLIGCAETEISGVKVVYNVDAMEEIGAETISKAKNIIGERIETLYSKNYEIKIDEKNTANRLIIVKIPNQTDSESISKTLGQMGKLQFVKPDGTIVIEDEDIIDAKDVYGAIKAGENSYYIQLTLSRAGSEKFADATEELVGEQIAIILDDVILSAPYVSEKIESENPIISGAFTREEAKELATLISIGELPFELKIESAEYLENIN